MPLTPITGLRRERYDDTKTLVRLGTSDRESGPAPKPAQTAVPEALEGGRRPNVHLWFHGVRDPVRARAVIHETALVLDAPLPFLELESVVGCVTADSGTLVHGRIRRVRLDTEGTQGVPRLQVEVGLDAGLDSSTTGDQHAILPPSAAVEDVPLSGLRPNALPAAPASAPRSRVLPVAALLVGLGVGAGATHAWTTARTARLSSPSTVPPALPSNARAPRTESATLRRVDPPSIVIALAAESADELSQSRLAQWLSRSDPLAAFVVSPPRALGDDADAADDEAEPSPPPEVALDAEASGANGQSDRGDRSSLQVRAVDTQTRVFVPMSGTADAMRQYELTTPGIAIILPYAVANVPLENYAVSRGLVRRVWLRRLGDGVQVRVITKRPASRVSASFDQDGLSVVLDM